MPAIEPPTANRAWWRFKSKRRTWESWCAGTSPDTGERGYPEMCNRPVEAVVNVADALPEIDSIARTRGSIAMD